MVAWLQIVTCSMTEKTPWLCLMFTHGLCEVDTSQNTVVVILFQKIQEYFPDFLSLLEHTLGFFQEETKFCLKIS
jgi:hypothetical protein